MADTAQDLVADEVAVVLVDVLEAVEVDQDERQRRAGRALGPLDLAREAVVQRGVIEAAGQGVRARGAGEAGVRAGVLEGHRRELGERLERRRGAARRAVRRR